MMLDAFPPFGAVLLIALGAFVIVAFGVARR